jgi:hypothetical protein
LLRKLVPFTVSVNAAPPATAEEGVRLVIDGTGLPATIVKIMALDVPPPGVGLKTVTPAVPIAAISSGEIEVVSWLLLIKLVVLLELFHRTIEVLTKFEPFTVNVKAEPPGGIEAGERLVMDGEGLLIVKVIESAGSLQSGLETVTFAEPPVAISFAWIEAVNVVLFTNVVCRLLPFH